ncbi:MAG: helix-turn-helix domain-containing protein [Halodesulfurarchaeum sp.]
MPTGIRAELSFDAVAACRIASITGRHDIETQSISRSLAPDSGRVTEEFTVDAEVPIPDEDLEEVFSYGDQSVYRFQRERDGPCPCHDVEQFGSPVVDVRTEGETLHLAVHVEDIDTLQEVVRHVRDRYPEVSVDRLVESKPEGETEDLVLVDRGDLTRRQREVLETAHRLGYFDHPKGANAGEVADELGITTSTFTEHLAAAQSKLLSAILAE